MITTCDDAATTHGRDFATRLAAELAAAGAYTTGDEALFAAIAEWRAAERIYLSVDEDREPRAHRAAERGFSRADAAITETPAHSLAGVLAKLTVTLEDNGLWEMAARRGDLDAQRMIATWLDLTRLAFDAGVPIWPPAHIRRLSAGRVCSRMVRERAILPGGATIPNGWYVDASDECWRIGETFQLVAFAWEVRPVFIKAIAPRPPRGRQILGRLIGSAHPELQAPN